MLDGESTGVFQGKIIVRPLAQKTDGRMMSQAAAAGDGATMNNKPELEIFADDVQCAHGATCGRSTTTCCSICGTRHSQAGGGGADAAGLCRRSARTVENEAAARVAGSAHGRGLAEGEGMKRLPGACPHPRNDHERTRCAPYDVAAIRADFPILSHAGLRQAARLSRQRCLGPEAAGR